jgi:hypothetical protein
MPHGGASQRCAPKHAAIEFLDAEKESVRNMHKRLFNVCGSAAVDRSTAGRWTKTVTASETGTAELHDMPRSGRPVIAVTPEMLQRADAIVREDRRITTRQLGLGLSISKGSVVTLFRILDTSRCARDGFLGDSHTNIKPREKPFLPSCWHVLKLRERPSYPRLLQQMKPGNIILNFYAFDGSNLLTVSAFACGVPPTKKTAE